MPHGYLMRLNDSHTIHSRCNRMHIALAICHLWTLTARAGFGPAHNDHKVSVRLFENFVAYIFIANSLVGAIMLFENGKFFYFHVNEAYIFVFICALVIFVCLLTLIGLVRVSMLLNAGDRSRY